MIFHNFNDLRRYVSDQVHTTDFSSYTLPADDLIDIASRNMADYLHEQGYVYGDDAGEALEGLSTDMFFGFFE